MGFQDRFFRDLERNSARKSEQTRTNFVNNAEAARNAAAVKPDDFRGEGIYTDEEIDHDNTTTALLAKKYQKPLQERFIASALELVVERGIQQGRFFSPQEGDTIESINTSKYDDYANRVDAAATIHRADGEDLTFALDLYSGTELEKALEKISVASHVDSKHRRTSHPDFAGFTEISYYEDINGKARKINVPRYTIGMDKKSIFAAVDEIGGSGNLFSTVGINEIKFKMLYEMSKQNELYSSYLYDYEDSDAYTGSDAEFEQRKSDMEELDSIYLRELESVKEKLGPAYAKLDYDQIAAEFRKKDQVFDTIIRATKKIQAEKEKEEIDFDKPENLSKAKKTGARIFATLKRLTTPTTAKPA